MTQAALFSEPYDQEQKYALGNGFVLELSAREKSQCKLLYYDKPIKIVDLSDKVAKKLLVIEAVDLGIVQARLADALEISRQTIHNYLQTHKYFGLEGLIHGYNPADSKSLEVQRKSHACEREQGNKSEQVAAIRAEQREAEKEQQESVQASMNFSFGEHDRSRQVGCGLRMMCSTVAFGPELSDLFPELRPPSAGLGEGT
jgi:hypothetical protein